MRNTAVAIIIALLGATACQKGTQDKDKPAAASKGSAGSAAAAKAGSAAPAVVAKDIDTKDILERTETAPMVYVKHILLGWKENTPPRGGDPRAAKRSNEETAKLALDLAAKLKADPSQLDALVKEHSEDPGMAAGDAYPVKAETPFVPEFKKLALRLKEKEVGIVKTNFGYHVMMRVAAPPADPVESNDILARPESKEPVQIQHILIGWKDSPAGKAGRSEPRAMARTKEAADKLAKELLEKAKKGDMVKLMKEFSEDPGSKDTGKPYDVGPDTQMVDNFKPMALRMQLDEVAIAKSPYGWHIMKRVPPPPPDSLESADILKRPQAYESGKVKHILLSWSEMNPQDDRAKKRDRKALEKLVKDTVAKLQKGEKIEPLMAELSEDPGSAKTGNSYDVSPSAGLVPEFKNLSLRLQKGEVGVVKTQFGIHIIQRVE